MSIKFAYEYRNHYTDGRWARTAFEAHVEGEPTDWPSGIEILRQRVRGWTEGTELRLVEITTTERASEPIDQKLGNQ